jgi:hypothetical protein
VQRVRRVAERVRRDRERAGRDHAGDAAGGPAGPEDDVLAIASGALEQLAKARNPTARARPALDFGRTARVPLRAW